MFSLVVDDAAEPRGPFPHLKWAGGFAFVSGTSSRRPDGTIEGATPRRGGGWDLDMAVQTRAVFRNIERILHSIDSGLDDLVEVTVFITEMSRFDDYNTAYGELFDSDGPARTTVEVSSLPHPRLLIEARATAYVPAPPSHHSTGGST